MKQCTKCKEMKSEDQFAPHRYHTRAGNLKIGLASWCRACHGKHMKQYTKTSKFKEKNREYRAKNRDIINAKYRERYQLNAEERRVKSRRYTENRELSISSYLKRLASHKRRHAKVVCTIDWKYLLELYNKQNGLCVLTGRRMTWRNKPRRTNAVTDPNTLSIDRIDQSKGYIQGNIRLVTWHANHARMMWSDEILAALCRDIIEMIDAPYQSPSRARPPQDYVPMQ